MNLFCVLVSASFTLSGIQSFIFEYVGISRNRHNTNSWLLLSIDSESIKRFTKLSTIQIQSVWWKNRLCRPYFISMRCRQLANGFECCENNERSALVHHVIFTFVLTYFSMNFSTCLKLRHLQSEVVTINSECACLILHQSLSIDVWLLFRCPLDQCWNDFFKRIGSILRRMFAFFMWFIFFKLFSQMIPDFGHFHSMWQIVLFDININIIPNWRSWQRQWFYVVTIAAWKLENLTFLKVENLFQENGAFISLHM